MTSAAALKTLRAFRIEPFMSGYDQSSWLESSDNTAKIEWQYFSRMNLDCSIGCRSDEQRAKAACFCIRTRFALP